MEVRLAPGALEITTIVENRGNDTMPFSFGLHPYFNLSSLEGVRFEGLPLQCLNHLTMEEASTADQLERLASGIDLLVRPTGAVRLVDEHGAVERTAAGPAERRPQTRTEPRREHEAPHPLCPHGYAPPLRIGLPPNGGFARAGG
jgi:hypothetical protein